MGIVEGSRYELEYMKSLAESLYLTMMMRLSVLL